MLVQRVTHAAISTAGLALAVALWAAGLCPLATEAQAKSDAVANDARVAGDRERTRFIADLSRKVELRVYALGNPYRVIVDAPDVSFQMPDGIGKERLMYPRLYASDQWLDTGWDQALAIYGGLVKKILDSDSPGDVMYSCFDHGGAGGGFENTWGTGKLMFSAIQTPVVRIHNRPAYNSECHATREMGVGELNNSYEDAELADVIFATGTRRNRQRR